MKNLCFVVAFFFTIFTQTVYAQDTAKYFKIVTGSITVNRDKDQMLKTAAYNIVTKENDFLTVSKYSVKIFCGEKVSFNLLANWKKRLFPKWNDFESEVVDGDDVRCSLQLVEEYSSSPKNSWELIIRYKTFSLSYQLIRDTSKE